MDITTLIDAAKKLQAQVEPGFSRDAEACIDMVTKLRRFGSFKSERQQAYFEGLVAKANGVSTPAAPAAQLATFSAVKGALDAAFGRGIKRPAMHITRGADYTFKRAPDTGRNPGNVYVTRSGLYVGKIDPTGAFTKSRDCEANDVESLTAIAVDPLAAARESGKLTGRCSCCGRELSDPVSIQNGIGPICEAKYFA